MHKLGEMWKDKRTQRMIIAALLAFMAVLCVIGFGEHRAYWGGALVFGLVITTVALMQSLFHPVAEWKAMLAPLYVRIICTIVTIAALTYVLAEGREQDVLWWGQLFFGFFSLGMAGGAVGIAHDAITKPPETPQPPAEQSPPE